MSTGCVRFTAAVAGLAKTAATIIGLALLGTPATAGADGEAARLDEATAVLEEIMGAPDSAIPEAILDRAVAIAVFPSTFKAGFIFGAQRGRGFIAARDADTGAWSAPAFLTLTGGNVGLQVGAQSVDVVLVIQNRRGLTRLLANQFKLGGDALRGAGAGRPQRGSVDGSAVDGRDSQLFSNPRRVRGCDARRRDAAGGPRRERTVLRAAARLDADRAGGQDRAGAARRGDAALVDAGGPRALRATRRKEVRVRSTPAPSLYVVQPASTGLRRPGGTDRRTAARSLALRGKRRPAKRRRHRHGHGPPSVRDPHRLTDRSRIAEVRREQSREAEQAGAPGTGSQRGTVERPVASAEVLEARLAEAERLFNECRQLTPYPFVPLTRAFDSFADYAEWKRGQTNPWYR